MRSSAWIWDFSSTHNTSAPSGGLRYRPTMSRTLSTNSGSGESLKVSTRWGFSPKARQIRLMADWLMPVALAIDRVDQWVASVGVSSKVFTITGSTSSSPMVRGAPGRGSSWSPSSRRSMKRLRHLPTVGLDTPRRWATSMLLRPSAHVEHDPATQCQRLCALGTACPTLERFTLVVAQTRPRWSAVPG